MTEPRKINSRGGGGRSRPPIFRREKTDPCADMWHTLAVGVPLAVVLFLVLPFFFN